MLVVSATAHAWDRLIDTVLGADVQDGVEWTDVAVIRQVLATMGSVDGLVRVYYPDGGWHLMGECSRSREEGCIEITREQEEGKHQRVVLLKPLRLVFRAAVPGAEPGGEWDYFRLTAAPFQPTGVYEAHEIGQVEEVMEDEAVYLPLNCFDMAQRHDGAAVTSKARTVTRCFKGGDFLLVSDGSPYNLHSGAAGGQHSRLNDDRLVALMAQWHQTLIQDPNLLEKRMPRTGMAETTMEYEGKTLYRSSSYEYGPMSIAVDPGRSGVVWSVSVIGETKSIAHGGPTITSDAAMQEAEEAAAIFIQQLGGIP